MRSTDRGRGVLYGMCVCGAKSPRSRPLAVAATFNFTNGLSLGGSSRTLSLCGWPACCLLSVGVDALLAQPEPLGCLAASAEQQEELVLSTSRPLRRARSRRGEAI